MSMPSRGSVVGKTRRAKGRVVSGEGRTRPEPSESLERRRRLAGFGGKKAAPLGEGAAKG